MIDKKKLATLKKKLLEEKKSIEEKLSTFTDKNKHFKGGYRTKYVDYGDTQDDNIAEVEQYATNLSVDQYLEHQLRQINIALKKIEEGTYGSCTRCGKNIPIQRLEAFPGAQYCYACKRNVKK